MFPSLARSISLGVILSAPLYAQQSAPPTQHDQPGPHLPVSAKVLVGLPDVASNTAGGLSFQNGNLHFVANANDLATDIPSRRILTISAGEERIETGGTAGRVVRMVIPYGGGLAVGAVTHKKIGLLTVEFLDPSGQYHGAVFALDKQDLDAALAGAALRPVALAPHNAVPTPCPVWKVQPGSVRVDEVAADDQSGFPAEDRVLLYERLVQKLQGEKTILHVDRAGKNPPAAGCPEFTVKLRATSFIKGDQALRASVGPLGHFVGATKLSFHLTITREDGTSVLEADMKKSEGADSDSLNITKVITKAVAKNLKKTRSNLNKTQDAQA